jgi:hypothetical protein
VIETIEQGKMTKDLAICVHGTTKVGGGKLGLEGCSYQASGSVSVCTHAHCRRTRTCASSSHALLPLSVVHTMLRHTGHPRPVPQHRGIHGGNQCQLPAEEAGQVQDVNDRLHLTS